MGNNNSKDKTKKTRRQIFLDQMEQYVPWEEWLAIIRPLYYEQGKRGRPPYPLELIFRMFLLQAWFTLSDEAVEEALYDSRAMADFAHVTPGVTAIPDETTILRFRHLLEEKGLCKSLFDRLAKILEENGVMMRGGSIVDATILSAPSSTKNKDGARDPEMHQTKKGNQWYYGFKAHTAVDAGSGLVHSVETTAANVADIAVAAQLLREDDTVVYGDSGYTGINKRPEIAGDASKADIDWRINRKKGTVKGHWEREIERQKSSVRSKVEHPFHIIKQTFGFVKTAYRGIAKNACRLFILFASANILMCARAGRHLSGVQGESHAF